MAKRKVLIIDDDVALSLTIKNSLEQTGPYEAIVQNNPKQAIATALEFIPDIVILDVIMPVMDGGDVAAAIRENSQLKDTPIIFLTSILQKDEEKSKDGKVGNEPFLAKPVTIDALTTRIEEVLKKN